MTVGEPGRTVRAVTAVRRHAPELGAPAFRLPAGVRIVGAAVFAAVVQVGVTLVASQHQPEARSLDAFAVALLLAGPAALLVRRRRPALALVLAFVPTMTYWVLDYARGPIFVALLIAFVNAVMRGHRALAWASLGLGYVITAWITPLVADDGPWPDWSTAAGVGAWLLTLGAVTELGRSWLERSAERAQARAEESRRRASEERLRIARELHDVLAHNISLINVRAGVALHLVDERPDQIDADHVRPALAAIKEASKDALGELRSVLDVLRQGEAAPLAPTAGLRDLDTLAERARGTGLDVRIEALSGVARSPGPGDPHGTPGTEATLDNAPRPADRDDRRGTPGVAYTSDVWAGLPAGVDLAAFRIAQEALTNVVRHAQATRVTVRVRRTDDELEVQVDDDGRGVPRGTRGDEGDAGRGIAGMRERALALGGTLEAGPRPGRGFRVRARFPLRGDA
jgi:signal transduction histidine kinase